MKRNIININLSKDTPPEALAAVYKAFLKTGKEKPSKRDRPLYAFNEDIEKLHERYEQLFKQVKSSLNLSEKQIEQECDTLSRKYDFELDELSKYRKVDYDIKLAEIKAREDELKPVRHRRVWRLLFRRLTNRAQDIIEERAELDAHAIHTKAEKQIDEDWKRLFPDSEVKLSKREIKRLVREKLKAAIEQADKMETNEVLNATENVQNAAENVEKQEAKQTDKPAELKPENVVTSKNAEQATEPPEPPARKPRKNKQQLGVDPL